MASASLLQISSAVGIPSSYDSPWLCLRLTAAQTNNVLQSFRYQRTANSSRILFFRDAFPSVREQYAPMLSGPVEFWIRRFNWLCLLVCSLRPRPEDDAEFLHGVLESIARIEVSRQNARSGSSPFPNRGRLTLMGPFLSCNLGCPIDTMLLLTVCSKATRSFRS
jgi:hypothetical protein